MITKLRRKLLLHLEKLWVRTWKKCSEEFLPQLSDFIYAIIVEEYGLIGGFGVLILYLLLLSIRGSSHTRLIILESWSSLDSVSNDISSDNMAVSRIITGKVRHYH
jgi:hypothetical protein